MSDDFWEREARMMAHKADRHAFRLDRINRMFNEPCDHPGCKSHVSHPCEGCGRRWGVPMDIPGIELPKEILAALDAAKELPGQFLEDLLKRGIDKLAMMYGETEAPCKEEVTIDQAARAKVVIEYDLGDGQEARRVYELKPENVQVSERQQWEAVHDCGEEKAEIRRVGNPVVVVVGELIGSKNHQFCRVPPPELDIGITHIADVVTFKFLWAGEQVAQYELTESVLNTESFRHHLGIMIDRAFRSIVDLGEPIQKHQIHTALERACSIQWGIAWMNSAVSQPSTRSSEG
jgi:hypothetical protein